MNNTLSEDNGKEASALPISLLYGANGAGKSNLFKAMKFASNLIVDGTKGDQSLGNKKFRLDKACLKKPTAFTFEFKNDGVIFDYGFAIINDKVIEEWLYGKYVSVAAYEASSSGDKMNAHRCSLRVFLFKSYSWLLSIETQRI